MGTGAIIGFGIGFLALSAFTTGFAVAGPPSDKEAELNRKLEREQNPVKKAKIAIRLSRLKLQAAREHRDRNEVGASLKLLEDYRGHIQTAWTLLQRSGRAAHKKPEGFKELDIALREDGGILEDFKRSFSLADREPIEQIIADTGRIRSEVLKSLFPNLDGSPP